MGTRLEDSLKAAEMLEAKGLSTTVADARFMKPLDQDLIKKLADDHEVFLTVEEGVDWWLWLSCPGSFVRHGLFRQRAEGSDFVDARCLC